MGESGYTKSAPHGQVLGIWCEMGVRTRTVFPEVSTRVGKALA